jgi:energy-coupling factor transport system permease protein
MFNQYFDNKKIVYLIGGRFPSTALIISMVFCFYDKFLYKIDKIKEVWRTFEKKGRLSKIRNAGIVLSVLLSAMLEDSVDTAKSMNARGYGTGKRTRYTPYTWKKIDFMIVLCAVAAVLLPIEIVAIIAIIPTIYNICKEIQWKFYLWRI